MPTARRDWSPPRKELSVCPLFAASIISGRLRPFSAGSCPIPGGICRYQLPVRIPAADRDKAPFRWHRENSHNRRDRSAWLRSRSKQDSPILDVMTAQFGAEGDDHVLFGANLLAQGDPGVARRAVTRPANQAGNRRRRETRPRSLLRLPESCRIRRLPPQFDGRGVDDVELRAPQAHICPDLPSSSGC